MSMQNKAQMVEAVLFFNDRGVCKEMLFPEFEALLDNVRALVDAVQKARPAGAKGTYLQRLSVSSTMGPGVKVEVGSVGAAS